MLKTADMLAAWYASIIEVWPFREDINRAYSCRMCRVILGWLRFVGRGRRVYCGRRGGQCVTQRRCVSGEWEQCCHWAVWVFEVREFYGGRLGHCDEVRALPERWSESQDGGCLIWVSIYRVGFFGSRNCLLGIFVGWPVGWCQSTL